MWTILHLHGNKSSREVNQGRSLGQPRLGMSKQMLREAIDGYLFVGPWLVGFILFVAGPMVGSLLLSFTDWDLFSRPTWAGSSNYRQLYRDRLVALSLWNSAYYTFLRVPLGLLCSLLLALICVQMSRFQALFRTCFYLPSVTPAVASAIVWFWILNPEVGLANSLLRMMRLPTSLWLWDASTSKPTFVLMSLWRAGGNAMVIFLAGLQNIPQSLYEAAEIDGANEWQKFRSVTIPMLSPIILFNLVMAIIGSFQVFTGAYLMTQGGPQNSTLFAVLYLYRLGFEQYNMGFASAFAWLLLIIILIFTLGQLRLSKSWVYYEGG